jgi:hypothetical protein
MTCAEFCVALQIVLIAGILALAVRVHALPRVITGLRRVASSLWGRWLPLGHRGVQASRLLAITGVAATVWCGPHACLLQALLLLWVLWQADKPPVLVLGLQKSGAGVFHGHAWIEIEGKSVGESSRAMDAWTVLVRY